MFRAGTSHLKRQSLFRSCRREASPKTQGLSEDASHHAREHKTPTEGTANGIHRPAPKNQPLRYSGFLTLPLKVCCLSAEKVFGSTPFSKGVAGLQGGEPCKENRVQGRNPAKRIGCRAGALQREPGCGAGHPAGVSRLGFRVSLSQSNRMPSAAHFRRSSSLQREDWTCPTCTFSKITIQILDCPMPPPTVRGSSP